MNDKSMRSEHQCSDLVVELDKAKELAIRLKAHVDQSSELDALCKTLLSSIEKSIQLAKLHSSNVHRYSSYSGNESPGTKNDDSAIKDQQRKEIMFKKRKTMPKWTNQVRLDSRGNGIPIDDGYSWRKYGQKDILGAKYPRGYYRCTHRNKQGCLATKQVQRSDVDPQVFDIMYHGTHTCMQTGASRSYVNMKHEQEKRDMGKGSLDQFLNFETSLKVKTEDLDCENALFSFGSGEIDSFNMENIFSLPSTPESYLSLSPGGISSYDIGYKLHASEFYILEMNSMTNSPSDSPVIGMDFLSNLDPEFDTSSYLA